MSVPGRRRARFDSRSFYYPVLCITLLAAYSLLFLGPSGPAPADGRLLSKRQHGEQPECREVHHAADKCAFVEANCHDDEAGLLSYLTFYYCTLGSAQPLAFVFLVVWLGLLFSTIGIAASDFFSVNLSTIATVLGLSESLAGVTFLAFGNGSPDVFSTFAAMGSNSGSMAVGELIGAAGFITAVVAGSMALVREFKVSKKTFVRDICFFIVAVCFTMVFLADGHLHFWECGLMIGFYIFYVITVVGWHWWSTRRRRRRLRDAASRGHYFAPRGEETDELEPFRDDEDDDDDTTPMGSRATTADISALERAPRIEIEGRGVPEDDEEDERGRQVATEMSSSMRVTRPRGRRSNTTITPIRPSLVGALEFRSILATLQKERNMQLAPLHARRYSDNPAAGHQVPLTTSIDNIAHLVRESEQEPQTPVTGRERALSSGDAPLNLERFTIGGGRHLPHERTSARSLSPGAAAILGPHLLPPGQTQPSKDYDTRPTQRPPSPKLPQLRVPSPDGHSTSNSTPPLMPFPGMTESPRAMTPQPQSPTFMLPGSSMAHHTSAQALDDHDGRPRPVRWWPYHVLPPPHVLVRTLFPTIQGWKDKSIWDKFVSVVSVPSIFCLVTTLPVVETERNEEDDSESGIVDPPPPGSPGHVAPPVSIQTDGFIEPETEWQRYRRSTRSSGSRTPGSRTPSNASPLVLALDSPGDARQAFTPDGPMGGPHALKPVNSSRQDIDTLASEEGAEWNRWLVVLQLFTGPLFVVFIIWANMEEDMENPARTLLRLLLSSLVMSLILLAALLLTTSPHKRPKYHFVLCFLGFIISVAWISTVAGEVVGILKAFGVILGISEAILGLTIFAVGNSVGDLVADVTVARLGYPVMALAACFGGPMLNILLGVGLGGVWMTMKAANEKHAKKPNKPIHYKSYHIEVSGTLMISAITVLLTLVILLIVVPMNKWIMSRKIGWGLIAIWMVSTIINVVVEVTGIWGEVA